MKAYLQSVDHDPGQAIHSFGQINPVAYVGAKTTYVFRLPDGITVSIEDKKDYFKFKGDSQYDIQIEINERPAPTKDKTFLIK